MPKSIYKLKILLYDSEHKVKFVHGFALAKTLKGGVTHMTVEKTTITKQQAAQFAQAVYSEIENFLDTHKQQYEMWLENEYTNQQKAA